jgi:hypothetical protein
MKADKEGICINKAELGALLFFAGGPTKDGVVKFRVNAQQKLIACARDGKLSLVGSAKGGDHERGEWAVPAFYLERLRRSIDKGKNEVLLDVDSKGLKHARLVGAATHEKQMRMTDETNGTSTQLSIDECVEELDEGSELTGGWFAFQPKSFNRAVDVVSKAAEGCPITIYPPNLPLKPVCFEASCEGGRWRGKLMPAAVVAPGDEAEKDPDEERPGQADPGKAKAKAQASLPNTGGGDDSGVVDDEYAEKLKTQKRPKKKAAKKAAKKRAKKS